jgi:predicted ester cyclase
MSAEQTNLQIARTWIQRTMNEHDLDAVDEFVHPEFRSASGPELQGPAGEREGLGYLFSAFPDFSYEVKLLIAEGDRVALHGTARGTHTGEFMGLEGTGKSFAADSIEIMQFKDGKCIVGFPVFDMKTVCEQLGIPEQSS